MSHQSNIQSFVVSKKDTDTFGEIKLDGSKSISNRVLIIRALSGYDFKIENLSTSDDTTTLDKLLSGSGEILDCGHAGTTYRFLTAYLSLQKGTQILTGSERMLQRPIGPLVDVLGSIGANIKYLGETGYPPLEIGDFTDNGDHHISIPGHISSQYISALVMIAPVLDEGLTITIEGDLVSRPYLEMTLSMMQFFGVTHEWSDNVIAIKKQEYQNKDFVVESDWSAASYYYAIAALSDQAEIKLSKLFSKSLQGDADIAVLMDKLGITTTYEADSVTIKKQKDIDVSIVEHDLIKTPDIAQTLAVIYAGLGITANFTGLQTLKIKETDRIEALKVELAKVHSYFSALPSRFSQKTDKQYYMLQGKATIPEDLVSFDTYKDHRMAMAFAPLAQLGTIQINQPMVVTKSYPQFWEDLKSLGFVVG